MSFVLRYLPCFQEVEVGNIRSGALVMLPLQLLTPGEEIKIELTNVEHVGAVVLLAEWREVPGAVASGGAGRKQVGNGGVRQRQWA